MDATALLEKSVPKANAANILLAAFLCVWGGASLAGQSSGQFPVTINLQKNGNTPTGAAPASVLCRSGTGIGAFGSTLTVVCATGAGVAADATGNNASKLPWTTMPDNTYRFMFSTYREGEQSGTVDSYNGAGTVTSWRMIKLDNRDYIEMMLHW